MQKRDFTMEKIRKDRNGFTLIELMIAIVILGIVTIPIMSYFGDASAKNAENRTRQNAVVQAQDILEEFKNTSYSLDDSTVVCNNDASATKWTVKTPADPSSGNDNYVLQKTVKIDKSLFTIEAEIDPIQQVVASPSDSTVVIDYERSVVGTMDAYKDVLISESGQSLLAAKLFFYGKHADECAANNAPPVVSMQEIEKHLQCTILIKGYEEPSAGPLSSGNVVVEAVFSYQYIGTPGYPLGINASMKYEEPVKVSSLDPKELTNIYLFYQPTTASAISGGDILELDADSFFGDSNNIQNGQLKLFIIAQSSVAYNASDVPAGYEKRKMGYTLDLSDISAGSYFKNKIGKVYTNLSFGGNELFAPSFTSDQLAMNTTSTEYTLVDQEEMNRVADITVRIIKEGKEYAVVNGSKVQD